MDPKTNKGLEDIAFPAGDKEKDGEGEDSPHPERYVNISSLSHVNIY